MDWLTPNIALWSAAIAIPSLFVLYFLKLKRQEQFVASSLLWKRAIMDMQVNAPFQRLRKSLLLLLQLLAIILMLLAIAGPVFYSTHSSGKRYVILIDNSGSMLSQDIQPTRLQEAKNQAKEIVDNLRAPNLFSIGDEGDMMMVIAFNDRSRVMCNFTSDKSQLKRTIDMIEPCDSGSSIANAVNAARAFAMSEGEAENNRTSVQRAQIIIFSDGQLKDIDQISATEDEIVFHSIGTSGNNIAITEFKAVRSNEDPQDIMVFASISNYTPQIIKTDLQFTVNNQLQDIKALTLPAMNKNEKGDITPGKNNYEFNLSLPDQAVIELRLMHQDDLPNDNAAWYVLPRPDKQKVLYVSNGNPVLEQAILACDIAEVTTCTETEFQKICNDFYGLKTPYDTIILDNILSDNLPKASYLIFNALPNGYGASYDSEIEKQFIVDWQQTAAALRYVNLDGIFTSKASKIILPRDAVILADFEDTPAISFWKDQGNDFLYVAFDVMNSNWPFESSFVLFCYNSLNFLGMQNSQTNNVIDVGNSITQSGLPPETPITINGPDLQNKTINVDSAGQIRIPAIQNAGLYSIKTQQDEIYFYAANMLDEFESNPWPKAQLNLSGHQVLNTSSIVNKVDIQVWPWLVLAVLIMISIEWLVYVFKMKL